MNYRLGIDLGGTSGKLGIVNARQKIVKTASVSSHKECSAKDLIKDIGVCARHLVRGFHITKVGVGVAGDIDSDRGIVRISPNLKWKNVPLRKWLRPYLGPKIFIDNDANAAAWGIYKTQFPKRIQNIMVLTLGTGVGGGFIIDGHVHRGCTGSAGEIGHLTIDEFGRKCGCGRRGCLEAYAGGKSIVRYVTQEIKKGTRTSLKRILREKRKITPHDIYIAAQAGDHLSKLIWNDVGQKLGLAIGDMAYIFNPEVVVLTGGMAQAKNFILSPLKKELEKRPFKTPIRALSIQIAKQAQNIGIVGAALLQE